MHYVDNTTELSSHEETRSQFNGSKASIKLGIDVHQDFYTVVMQEGRNQSQAAAAIWEASVLVLGSQVKAKWSRSVRGL
jgi:hypothetical protein